MSQEKQEQYEEPKNIFGASELELSNFPSTKVLLKLEFDTEDQVLFILAIPLFRREMSTYFIVIWVIQYE